MRDTSAQLRRYDNGLRSLVREAHHAPVAELQIWAQVGSADERPGEAGLAHFHEHMLFKGTERRGVAEIAGAIEGAGGSINAFTTFDVTVYHATVPASEWRPCLEILVDAVRHSVFDPTEIAREIEVVLEEIRRSDDSPGSVLANAVFAETYRAHPYRHPILGTRESVASLDRERLQHFFRQWYTPENLLVVAAGDFAAPEAEAAVADFFSGAVPGRTRRERPAEPAQDTPRSVVLRRPFERTSLELAWMTVPLAHTDTPYLDLLAFILGQGDSSRLVCRVQEREALADHIEAFSYTPLDAGVFGVSAESDGARCAELVSAAVREVERLRAEPVGRDELEKARANFLTREHFERESVSGLAHKLGSFQALAGDFRAEARYLQAVEQATPEDLQRVARTYLKAEQLTTGVLLPEAETKSLAHTELLSAVKQGVARTDQVFRKPQPITAAGTALQRSQTSSVSAPATTDIFSYRFANGAALHVVPRREPPVVGLRAALLGGQLDESEANAGITSFLSRTWLRGTETRSAEGLARAIESLAVEIEGFSGRNSTGLTLDCTRDQLDPALEILSEILLAPAFDPEEIERERRETLAAIARSEDNLAARAFQLFTHTHYDAHPYRLRLSGTPDSIQALTREALAAQHTRLVCAPNLVIGVAGDVEPDALAERLSALLADLPDSSAGFAPPSPDAPPREIRTAELRKQREQSHIVLGFRGLTITDPDRYALEVLTQMLAGQGGRLFLELRDRQSLAYTVSCANVEGVAPGFFALYMGTAPEKRERAQQSMFDQLAHTLDTPPSAEELRRAQRYLLGNFAIELQRASARAAHLAHDALYGLGADADRHYGLHIEAVTREDVLRIARRVIDLSAYTLAVIRP